MSYPATSSPSLKMMPGATGVVFGDIGTSPLYAFRESVIGHHRLPLDQFHVLGVLSMLAWALILVAAYSFSRQTLVPSAKPGMPIWQEHPFAAMVRNSEPPMSFFKLPINRVVELGSQVEI